MKKITLETNLTIYEDLNQLPQEIQSLMIVAKNVRSKAYAPYSKFTVGAALLLENGEVIEGSNQENASYPSGLCAERTAIYYAGAKFPDQKILALAITAGAINSQNDQPIPPCGACRQAIAEYELKQKYPIALYFMGVEGEIVHSHSLENILPLIFDNSLLEK